MRIANAYVFKEPVYNYSADYPFVWDEITGPVKYGSDHGLARKIIQQAAEAVVLETVGVAEQAWKVMVRKYAVEEASGAPSVTLIATDNWMEFTLRDAVDFKKRRTTKDRLFTAILDGIAASEGRVSMASATLHRVEAHTLDVRLHTGSE